MRTIEPTRWDDIMLAVLLLMVALPRLVLAIAHDRPLGAEGTLSMLFVAAALAIVLFRRR